jgi:hypothetical protein
VGRVELREWVDVVRALALSERVRQVSVWNRVPCYGILIMSDAFGVVRI